MKNTNFQDRFICDEVETHLRSSIPSMAKNIHESFATKPTGGFKQLLDRASLFAQEKFHGMRAAWQKAQAETAERESRNRGKYQEKSLTHSYARELGMDPVDITTIQREYPSSKPRPPATSIQIQNPSYGSPVPAGTPPHPRLISVPNPNFPQLQQAHKEEMKKFQKREELMKRIATVKADNPYIKAQDVRTTGEIGKITSLIPNLVGKQAISAQKAADIRQERINRGYLKP